MKRYNCEHCNDTGWYGDNGPGIEGNSEYAPCEECGRGKDRKCQARTIQIDSPLRRFTDAMHEMANGDEALVKYDMAGLLELLDKWARVVNDAMRPLDNRMLPLREFRNRAGTITDHTLRLARIAAEIAGRVGECSNLCDCPDHDPGNFNTGSTVPI